MSNQVGGTHTSTSTPLYSPDIPPRSTGTSPMGVRLLSAEGPGPDGSQAPASLSAWDKFCQFLSCLFCSCCCPSSSTDTASLTLSPNSVQDLNHAYIGSTPTSPIAPLYASPAGSAGSVRALNSEDTEDPYTALPPDVDVPSPEQAKTKALEKAQLEVDRLRVKVGSIERNLQNPVIVKTVLNDLTTVINEAEIQGVNTDALCAERDDAEAAAQARLKSLEDVTLPQVKAELKAALERLQTLKGG